MLKAQTLYLGDNGRAFCGSLGCAGMTAHYSGRDLSGQAVAPTTPKQAVAHNIRCEGCGFSPSLMTLAK